MVFASLLGNGSLVIFIYLLQSDVLMIYLKRNYEVAPRTYNQTQQSSDIAKLSDLFRIRNCGIYG